MPLGVCRKTLFYRLSMERRFSIFQSLYFSRYYYILEIYHIGGFFMAEMTAQEAAEWGKTLDFPTVWAALMEDKEIMKEFRVSMKDFKESMKEFRESMKELRESHKETAQLVAENSKQIGGLHNSVGDLVETLFAPHLGDKFDVYNYSLKRMFRRVSVYDDNNRLRTDIDILLSNTTLCMAVEVKRWLETTKHVDEHIKRMQLIRQYPPAEAKGKKLLGAIVGAVVTSEAREYAEQNGLFVLELTGEDVRLLEPPKDFIPREW